MTYRAYRKSGKTSHTTTDMGSLMRGPVSPRPFVPGNLSLSTRPPGDVRPSSPRDMPAGPTVAPGRPGPMVAPGRPGPMVAPGRPGPMVAPRGPLRVTPGGRQDTGGGRKKVPNRSGDPAGYNTKIFRNNERIINALKSLGYPVGSIGQSKKDAVVIKKFQEDFNKCSQRFGRFWGSVSENGMVSPDTLRALEVALVFSRVRQKKMIKRTGDKKVTMAKAWRKSCQKSEKGKPSDSARFAGRSFSSTSRGSLAEKIALQRLRAMKYTLNNRVWGNFQRDYQLMSRAGRVPEDYAGKATNKPSGATVRAVAAAYEYEKRHGGNGAWVRHVKKTKASRPSSPSITTGAFTTPSVVRAYSSSRPNVPPKYRWGWRGSPYNIPKPRKRRGGSTSTEIVGHPPDSWATKPKPRDSSIHSTRGQHPAGKHHPILSGWCWDEESEKVWRKGTSISRAAERTSTFYAGPSKYTVLNIAGVGVRRVERCDGYARARSFSSTSRPQPRDSVGYIRSRNPLHKRTKAQRWRR